MNTVNKLSSCADSLLSDRVFKWARNNIIRAKTPIKTPYGTKALHYFDYTASGLSFFAIEQIIINDVLPYMANTHSNSNYTSSKITSLYEESHKKIRKYVNANDSDVVIFTGSGATGAINKLINCLGLRTPYSLEKGKEDNEQKMAENLPIVIRSRMEHHSNDLPWRESIADMEFIGYTSDGRADWREIEKVFAHSDYQHRPLKIGTFTAASNVTGILNPVDKLAEEIHKQGGYAFFDYAAAAPYVSIDMHPDKDDLYRKDAVFMSGHKFLGGPQTPGILIANKDLFRSLLPSEPGGGTVLYTTPQGQVYLDDIQYREESGTPPIIQGIRAGLCFDLKHKIGIQKLLELEKYFVENAVLKWKKDPLVHILGNTDSPRIGIVSVILDEGRLHYNLGVRLLNDLYGIQVRGGCMCAGTYGHDLLGLSTTECNDYTCSFDQGDVSEKPGWIRISFGIGVSAESFEILLDAVPYIAHHWEEYIDSYVFDSSTTEWIHIDEQKNSYNEFSLDLPGINTPAS